MSILAVGSVAYDTVKTPFGIAEEALGGSACYFGVAAGFFSPVTLVACVGGDFRGEDRFFLESRNIDLRGLEVVPDGKTFRWKGDYSGDMNSAETLDGKHESGHSTQTIPPAAGVFGDWFAEHFT